MTKPGKIVLFGSGETSPEAGVIFEHLLGQFGRHPIISILETPAGFELNSAQVAGRIASFFQKRLQNFSPTVNVIPARKKGGPFSPDDPEILAPMLTSDMLFIGPGSPTYAVRQLTGSLAWKYLLTLHQVGVTICAASAGVIGMSQYALPVYEIFKVGEDPHWNSGLDLMGHYHLKLAFIPHWNNNEGGIELDTSHCFMGLSRFEILKNTLPANDVTLVGIDERTVLEIDPAQEICTVSGKGNVTIGMGMNWTIHSSGDRFSIRELGDFYPYDPSLFEKPDKIWDFVMHTRSEAMTTKTQAIIPESIHLLATERENARSQKDWKRADEIRLIVQAQGWIIRDTPNGPALEKA